MDSIAPETCHLEDPADVSVAQAGFHFSKANAASRIIARSANRGNPDWIPGQERMQETSYGGLSNRGLRLISGGGKTPLVGCFGKPLPSRKRIPETEES